jgi:hypothetical protein
MKVGELPKNLLRQKRYVCAYRRDLEAATMERHGEVSVWHAHLIDAACGAEVHAAVCLWLLRERFDKMTDSDRLACSRELTKAKETRNRAVKQLKLHVVPDVGSALYGAIDATNPLNDSEAAKSDKRASQAKQGDEKGNDDD